VRYSSRRSKPVIVPISQDVELERRVEILVLRSGG
jgi:hypothetical protein